MRNKKVYIRLIETYLIVFMIPLILNIVLLEDISRSTQENICENVQANLGHARDIVDNNFKEINTIVQKLSANSAVRYAASQLDEEDKYVEISRILSVQEHMESTQLQTLVEEYYLYLYESDMIISPGHIFLEENGVDYFFQYDNMTWGEWVTLLKQGGNASRLFPEAVTKQNMKRQKMILYVMPLITESGVRGNFIFPLKSEDITMLLKDTYISEAGWAYLADKEGNRLIEIPSENGGFSVVPDELLSGGPISEATLEGQRVKVIQTVSEDTGFRFVAVLPQEYIVAQISQAQKNMVLFMVLVLVVGAAAILAVSWHRGRKIDKILQMLFQIKDSGGTEMEDGVKGDELTYISGSLKRLIEKNESYRENIRRQEPVTRALLLERLLRGTQVEDTVENLARMGVGLSEHKILVIAYFMGESRNPDREVGIGESTVYKQMLLDDLNAALEGEKYTCDMDVNAGALLCAMEKSALWDKGSFGERMERACGRFAEEFGVEVRIVVGSVCESADQISKAYDEVSEMLQYGLYSGKHVLYCEEYMGSREYYYFPVPLEERLVNAVRSGNVDGMHEQMKEVYRVNVLERSISPSMMHFLVNDLQCTVFKALHSINPHVQIDEEMIYRQLEELNRENDILLRFNRINHIFIAICEKVKEDNSGNNDRQKRKIEEYLAEHYCESDLSLTKIADDFGYASTYFSKLFKEMFQENFAAYLERLRIEKVCGLLREGVTIEEIAIRTGYNSAYVLRTAFKRIKGMTPNEYRKMIQ